MLNVEPWEVKLVYQSLLYLHGYTEVDVSRLLQNAVSPRRCSRIAHFCLQGRSRRFDEKTFDFSDGLFDL